MKKTVLAAMMAVLVMGSVVSVQAGDRAMWDILFSFSTTSSSQGGVATNGDFIFTSSFSGELFRKFEMDGTFVEEFSISGVPQVGCMTYDGTYFYGAEGNTSSGIYVLDLENHSLVRTITVTASTFVAIGHISYDPELDGGNGGFWVGYWQELAAVDMDGNEIIAKTVPPGGIAGSAYDNITDPANPCLYLFIQSGSSNREFYKFDINSQTYSGVLHVATDIPGGSTNPVASGCNSYINNDGKLVLLGMIDHFPDNEVVFGYEISDASQFTHDISVRSLVSPVSGDGLTSSENVTVRIANNGSEVESGFDIQYTIDDGSGVTGPFTKNIVASIAPGAFVDVTFDQQADLSTPGLTYTFVVDSLMAGDGNSANDTLTKVVRNTMGVYCQASGSGGSEYIATVDFAGVTNSTTGDHYSNYSTDPSLLMMIEPGVATELTITIGHPYNADVGAVWIDWNADGDFSDDGAAFVSAFGQGPYVTDITSPVGALMDTRLRMRIRLDYNNSSPDPCGTTSFGEVEDYSIMVSVPTGIFDDGFESGGTDQWSSSVGGP
jgi:hypothetical protein